MVKASSDSSAEFDEDGETLVAEAIEALEEAWQSGASESIAPFVPPRGHRLRDRVLVELIKVDQEYRWGSGQPRLMEAYLGDWPELSGKRDLLRELVSAECLTRAALESIPTAAELDSRFPDIAGQIDLGAIAARAQREQGHSLAADADTADRSREDAEQTPSSAPTLPPLPPGQLFGRDGRYQIRELLGQGGMGSVYRAFDTRLGRDVALKIPRVDPAVEPTVVKRFVRESQAAARIRHPNICPIFDADQFEGNCYLTMALIEGQSLANWERRGTAEPRKAAELVGKLARALAVIHGQGIVHRDIKPSNVMVDRSGEPFLMDFGLARLAHEEWDAVEERVALPGPAGDSRLTHTGSLLGTLPYMSPEQAGGGEVKASSDVYSLGVLLYEALTGRLPFQGGFDRIRRAIQHETPPRLRALRPSLDAALEAICLKALAKDPAERPSAEELASDIDRYLQACARANGPARRRRLALASVAGAALVLLAVIISIQTKNGRITVWVDDPSPKITVEAGPGDGQPPPAAEQPAAPVVLSIDRWIEAPPKAVGVQSSRDDATLYVAFNEYPEPSRVQAFDVASGKLLQSVTSPNESYDHKGIALSVDGRYAYVTNYFRPDISRIDLRDNGRHTDLLIGGMPRAVWPASIAITPDKQKLVVAVGDDGRLEDLDNDQVSIVDVAGDNFVLAGQVRLPDEVRSPIAFSSDSRFAYFVTVPRKSAAPTLYEVKLTPPFAVSRRLPFPGGKLHAVAVSSRLKRAFVSDLAQKKIWVVDLDAFRAVSDLQLDNYTPGPLALDSRDQSLYVLSPEARKLFLLDPRDRTRVAQLGGLREGAAGIELSADGRRLFVWHNSSRGGVAVISVGNLPGGLAFASNRDGEGYQIYRIPPGESQPVRLTRNHAADRCPRWSPDGGALAYLSTEPGLPRICVTACRGERPRVLDRTDPALRESAMSLDWSPDGSQIAFIADQGRAIRAVHVDTGEVRSLFEGEIGEGCSVHLGLCWKRKDGLLQVNSQSPASSRQQGVFLLDPKTRRATPVASSDGDWRFYAARVASPDGKKFAALGALKADAAPEKIYMADAGSTDWNCLVVATTAYQPVLRWSDDGKRLFYSAVAGSQYHVFRVDIHGGRPVQVTHGDGDDIEPDVCGDWAAPSTTQAR